MPDGSHSFDPATMPELSRVAALYREHHAFVWRVLRRCGIPDADLDDAVQDTFLVLVRRLGDFDGRAAITTWLYAVAVRVASTRRRSRTREEARRRTAGAGVHATSVIDPEAELSRVEAAQVLDELLDELDDPKRTVFVLAELEGVRVPEISRILGVNVRTIHSRLRLARERFSMALRRRRARDDGRAAQARRVARRLGAVADERPTPARRKAVAAALIAQIETGTLPTLPGWQAITLAAPASFVAPLVATLAVGGAALGVTVLVVRPGDREVPLASISAGDEAPTRAAAGGAKAQTGRSSPSAAPLVAAPAAAGAEGSTPVADGGAQPIAPADPGEGRAGSDRTSATLPVGDSRAAPVAPASASTLAEETVLLEAARTALTQGDPSAALHALDLHAERFPAGELINEARSTRLRALCRAGRSPDAHALADALGPRRSRWHTIVDAACTD